MENNMQEEIVFSNEKITKKEIARKIIMLFVSAIIYAISVTCFINQSGGNIIASGASGLAMLISRVFFINNEATAYSIIYICINIPIFIIAFKYIGKLFSILTFLNVVVASTLIHLIPNNLYSFLNIKETVDATTGVVQSGLETITITIIAGVLTGFSIGVALKENMSTGGTDVISVFFGIKKGVSIGKYVFMLNCSIVLVYGIYMGINGNWHSIFYTLCYIFVSSTVVDMLFTRTKKVLIEVVSEKGNDIAKVLLENTHHGCTLIDGKGAFSSHGKQLLHIVVSVRQINDVIKMIREVDPSSFTIQLPVDNIYGKFYIPPFR